MGIVKTELEPPKHHLVEPVVLGTACGIVSSLLYTAANIYLRKLAGHVDPVWVSCLKASPVALVASSLVARRLWRAQRVWPTRRQLLGLVAASLFVHLGGNVAFQWTLAQIGLAITVPLMFGSLIISGAILGRVFLGEPITPRSAVAMLLLIAAIGVLSLGAPDANRSIAATLETLPRNSPLWLAAAVGTACLAGVAYAVLGVVIRRLVTTEVPIGTTLLVVSGTGILLLGSISFARHGYSQLIRTSPEHLRAMVAAGLFNMVAFFALTKSLQLISVVHSNALNASQAAMAGLAGVLLFGEAVSVSLVVGAALTVVGLVAMQTGHTQTKSPHHQPAEPATRPASQPVAAPSSD